MLTMILEFFTQTIGEALEVVVQIVLLALDMDLSAYNHAFPALYKGYQIFQGVAIGLAIVLAGVALLNFFHSSDRRNADTPLTVLAMTVVAGIGIYLGNHVLDLIVDIAKVPYGIFSSADFVDSSRFPDLSTIFAEEFLGNILTFGLSNAATKFVSLLVILLIGYNLLLLMLEVMERYMMVGILAYCSPLFFALVPNSGTRDSFRRWFSMFIGSCAMMTVSAFFLKLILSGFSMMGAEQEEFLLRLLLVLATCKIAQRVDTYMQQLGISVATTGQNMMSDFIAAGTAISRAVNGSKSSANGKGAGRRTNVLDGSASRGRFTGAAGGLAAGIKSFGASYRSGDSIGEAARKAKDAATATFKDSSALYKGVDAAKNAKADGASNLAAAAAGGVAAVKQSGENTLQAFAPNTMNAHRGAKTAKAQVEDLQAKQRSLGDDLQAENRRFAAEKSQNAAAKRMEADKIDNARTSALDDAKTTHAQRLNDISEAQSNSEELRRVANTRDEEVAQANATARSALKDIGVQTDEQGVPLNVSSDKRAAVDEIVNARDSAIAAANEKAEQRSQPIIQQFDDMRRSADADYKQARDDIQATASHEWSEHDARWTMIDEQSSTQHAENMQGIQDQIRSAERQIQDRREAYPDAFREPARAADSQSTQDAPRAASEPHKSAEPAYAPPSAKAKEHKIERDVQKTEREVHYAAPPGKAGIDRESTYTNTVTPQKPRRKAKNSDNEPRYTDLPPSDGRKNKTSAGNSGKNKRKKR